MMRNQGYPGLCRPIVIVLLALISCASSAQAKRKNDIIIFTNGDRLTGEIKGLQRGELEFKSDYMVDAVRVDWCRVERLQSKDRYIIVLTNGQLFTDFLSASATDNWNQWRKTRRSLVGLKIGGWRSD
jgi:hypothetical protein